MPRIGLLIIAIVWGPGGLPQRRGGPRRAHQHRPVDLIQRQRLRCRRQVLFRPWPTRKRCRSRHSRCPARLRMKSSARFCRGSGWRRKWRLAIRRWKECWRRGRRRAAVSAASSARRSDVDGDDRAGVGRLRRHRDGVRLAAQSKVPVVRQARLRGASADAEADAAYQDTEDGRLQVRLEANMAFFDYFLAARLDLLDRGKRRN